MNLAPRNKVCQFRFGHRREVLSFIQLKLNTFTPSLQNGQIYLPKFILSSYLPTVSALSSCTDEPTLARPLFNQSVSPSMKPTLTRLGGLFNSEELTIASTRRARRSDAATFDQNKQIFLSTLPRAGFNGEVFSYFSFYQLDCDLSRKCWRNKHIGLQCSADQRQYLVMVDEGPML